jgi:hypothetical protein
MLVTKPQDILIALKLALRDRKSYSFATLAKSVGMRASEVHASCSRLSEARHLMPDSRKVRRKPFLDFLIQESPTHSPPAKGAVSLGSERHDRVDLCGTTGRKERRKQGA